MRVIRMIVMGIEGVYTVLRWFVVGLSATGLRGMRLLCKDWQIWFCTFVKAVQPTPTMNTRSLSATIVWDCHERPERALQRDHLVRTCSYAQSHVTPPNQKSLNGLSTLLVIIALRIHNSFKGINACLQEWLPGLAYYFLIRLLFSIPFTHVRTAYPTTSPHPPPVHLSGEISSESLQLPG